jgi:hypothetical protein
MSAACINTFSLFVTAVASLLTAWGCRRTCFPSYFLFSLLSVANIAGVLTTEWCGCPVVGLSTFDVLHGWAVAPLPVFCCVRVSVVLHIPSRGVELATPPLPSAKANERIELYLYSPFGPKALYLLYIFRRLLRVFLPLSQTGLLCSAAQVCWQHYSQPSLSNSFLKTGLTAKNRIAGPVSQYFKREKY